jgi:hypothetical protein
LLVEGAFDLATIYDLGVEGIEIIFEVELESGEGYLGESTSAAEVGLSVLVEDGEEEDLI